MNKKRKFMITGAQLHNKGAQSMLYITTSELVRRFPDCEIYYCTTTCYDEEKYKFKKLTYYERSKRIAIGGIDGFFALVESLVKDFVKIVLRKTTTVGHYFDVKRIMPSINAVIDISGYSIGDKWDYNTHISYINNIRLASKYHIPVFLMPQSFGPFEYIGKTKSLLKKLETVMDYPIYVFSREKASTDELNKHFHLTNVIESFDLVLQNDHIELENVFKRIPEIEIPIYGTGNDNVVGIVPNIQCVNHGDKKTLFGIYKKAICTLLELKCKVVIFRHSSEDLSLCREIKEMFASASNVVLLEADLNCLEYGEFVKQFKYILCSRYHGLVHAYKNSVPCISIGWANKYNELLGLLNQEKYILSIDEKGLSNINQIICDMDSLWTKEKRTIETKMTDIYKTNCFDLVENALNKQESI